VAISIECSGYLPRADDYIGAVKRTRTRWPTVAVLALAFAAGLAGCGQGDTPASASLRDVPLAPGAKVVWQARTCDQLARAYCSIQFVIAGPHYGSAAALRAAQRSTLRRAGWSEARGDTDAERSSTSPHGKLRMTLATAINDLLSAEQGTIDRTPGVMRALSRQLFSQTPALSATLQTGNS
jgi:hypothetical protein